MNALWLEGRGARSRTRFGWMYCVTVAMSSRGMTVDGFATVRES